MRTRIILASFAVAFLTAWSSDSARPWHTQRTVAVREGRIPLGKASLYSREIGRGQPVIVLHGGPDFDHGYLLPDLDRWADAFRLIYYDQRGRGKSADQVRPEGVTLASDVDDLNQVMQHFRLGSAAVLGHSWGAVLALEYALRHPTRVSHQGMKQPPENLRRQVIEWITAVRKNEARKNAGDPGPVQAVTFSKQI